MSVGAIILLCVGGAFVLVYGIYSIVKAVKARKRSENTANANKNKDL